jgi:hypothetical protein
MFCRYNVAYTLHRHRVDDSNIYETQLYRIDIDDAKKTAKFTLAKNVTEQLKDESTAANPVSANSKTATISGQFVYAYCLG